MRDTPINLTDEDAKLLRDLLDKIEVWDEYDKALNRLLIQFPNDPLNKMKGNSQHG